MPNPVLRERCEVIAAKDIPSYAAIVQAMMEIMEASGGIGLAAPQVGLNKQIFVASETGKAADAVAMINPTIITDGESVSMMEGCLSLPGVRIAVARPKAITFVAFDAKGKLRAGKYDGMMARICQHEYDHLHGKLITDYCEHLE